MHSLYLSADNINYVPWRIVMNGFVEWLYRQERTPLTEAVRAAYEAVFGDSTVQNAGNRIAEYGERMRLQYDGSLFENSPTMESITGPMTYLKKYLGAADEPVDGLENFCRMGLEKNHYFNRKLHGALDDLPGLARELRYAGINVPDAAEYDYDAMVKTIQGNMDAAVDAVIGLSDRNYSESQASPYNCFADADPVINHWLLHMSDKADDIFKEGFKFGTDASHLGYSSPYTDKYGEYGFAYDISNGIDESDIHQHGRYRYGNQAVVFIGSGMKAFHWGDEEDQVMFDRNSVKGCFLISQDSSDEMTGYSVFGTDPDNGSAKKLMGPVETISQCANWIVNNGDDYMRFYPFHSGRAALPESAGQAESEPSLKMVRLVTSDVLKMPEDEFPLAVQQARKDSGRSERDDYDWIALADKSGGIFGICGYAVTRGVPRLYAVETSASAHGKGIGRKLVETVCGLLRNEGHRTVRLHPMNNDAGLIKFYEKCGFSLADTEYMGDGSPFLVMERKL